MYHSERICREALWVQIRLITLEQGRLLAVDVEATELLTASRGLGLVVSEPCIALQEHTHDAYIDVELRCAFCTLPVRASLLLAGKLTDAEPLP